MIAAERGNERDDDTGALSAAIRDAVVATTGLVPDEVLLLPRNALPLTSSGKVMRPEARRLYLEGRWSAPEPPPVPAPLTDGAARRAWLIRTLAGLAPDFTGEIGDETALAEGGLGLDSLALIDLVGALDERLGVTVLEREITGEHFGSVGRLCEFFDARLG